MTSFRNITFDDRDTDHLRYAGGWFLQGFYNASRVGDSGTLSSTDDTTANVSFTFTTPAKAFYYYAIPRCCGGLYMICIDCEPTAPEWITIDAVNTTDDGKNPPSILFSKEFDKPGIHEILLTNQPDARFGGHSQITLDRFELEIVDDNPSAAISGGSTVAETAPASSSSSPTASPQAASSSSSSPTSAIIGGAIGGAVFICIVFVLLFYFLCRRRYRQKQAILDAEKEAAAHLPPGALAQPFLVPLPSAPASSNGSERYGPSSQTTSLYSSSQGHGKYGYYYDGGHRSAPSQASMSESQSHATTSHSRSTSATRVPRRETDAGRIDVEEEEPELPTLPPEYEQVFSRRQTRDGTVASRMGHARMSSDAVPDLQPQQLQSPKVGKS